MKKRTIIPTIIGSTTGSILLILSIISCFFITNNVYYGSLLLIISSIFIILSSIASFYVNDRLFGFINLLFTIIAFIGLRMHYESFDSYMIPFAIVLLSLLSLITNFSSIILSIYRLPINQEVFDNKLFKEIPSNKFKNLIIAIINIIVLLIILISMFINKTHMPISIIVVIITILVIITGEYFSFYLKQRIGSLILCIVPILLLFGLNSFEFVVDNTLVLLILTMYVLSILLVINEMVEFKEGIETKIGPKEYKK